MIRLIPVPALSALSLALAAALPLSAHAASDWVATRTAAADVDAAAAGAELQAGTTLHISVSLALRNKADLDALTAAIMAGKTDRHLSSAEVLERHAPTPAQAQAVADYLRSAGFTNVEIAKNRHLVSADGTAATVKAAFRTELRHVAVDGRDAFANVSAVQVPAHLAGIVSAVHGLDTVHALHLYHRSAAPDAGGTSGVVGHKPMEFSTI